MGVVRCFWLEFDNQAEWGLRRYTGYRDESVPQCPRDGGRFAHSHEGLRILGQHAAVALPDDRGEITFAIDSRKVSIQWPKDDDPRWPTHCECGFEFRPGDARQRWTEMLYRRPDTGELTTIRSAPPGAMWDALWWPKSWWHGPDGRHLVVKCPNGRPWHIDDRASNCTMPDDNVHRCWIRHGVPPNLTVDKNGLTCAAGAGSILAGDYHGFLQGGTFTDDGQQRDEKGRIVTPTPAAPTRLRGLRTFDPQKHARFTAAEGLGFTWPSPSYPIDRTGGVTDLGMGGNGPDDTLTVNGGQPVGDCGPNAVPKNVGQTTAALGGVSETPWSSDRIVTLYFLYQAMEAGISWRPPALGAAWTQADIDQAKQLDLGVDLGDWLLWLATHDEAGNTVAVGQGLVEGFVALELDEMDAALGTADAVIAGVALNDQADEQFDAFLAGKNDAGWDVGPGDESDPRDGHAIEYAYAESPSGPYEWGTWGKFVPSTHNWKTACVQQAFAILTKETCESKSLPFQAIAADIIAAGGTAPQTTTWSVDVDSSGHGTAQVPVDALDVAAMSADDGITASIVPEKDHHEGHSVITVTRAPPGAKTVTITLTHGRQGAA